jgi:hypothetical protein
MSSLFYKADGTICKSPNIENMANTKKEKKEIKEIKNRLGKIENRLKIKNRLGEIFIWSSETIPDYAVACEGQSINSTDIKIKASGTDTRTYDPQLKNILNTIPDLRGLFVRGVLKETTGPLGQNKAVELNKAVADSIGPHNHRVRVKKTYATSTSKFPDGNAYINANDNYSGESDVAVTGVMDNNPGIETAPKHIGMYYCMVVN